MTINILFFGTPDFSAEILRSLIDNPAVSVKGVITQIDKPAGRGSKISESPVKILALENKIPIFQPKKLKSELDSFQRFESEHGPFDIGIVVAFGQILPPQVLQTPSRGCLNIHASLLPRWRGADPIRKALQEGDLETGISLMNMDEGMDTGAVYKMESLKISKDMTFDILHDELAKLSVKMLEENLASIMSGTLVAMPQHTDGVTYANKNSNEDAKIDWNKPASVLHNLIRGFSPIPGAFTFIRGKRLKILKASVSDDKIQNKPGTILLTDKRKLEVGCGTGILSLLEVQPEGKRRMNVEEFLAGNRLSKGDVLGERD